MVEFFVRGNPRQQGSKVPMMTKSGRPYMREHKSEKLRAWRRAVSQAARKAMGDYEPIGGPVGLAVDFFMPRGKTVKREHHTVTPDLDKLTRAVGDALAGVVFTDDKQIVSLYVRKTYAKDGNVGAQIAVFRWRGE